MRLFNDYCFGEDGGNQKGDYKSIGQIGYHAQHRQRQGFKPGSARVVATVFLFDCVHLPAADLELPAQQQNHAECIVLGVKKQRHQRKQQKNNQ